MHRQKVRRKKSANHLISVLALAALPTVASANTTYTWSGGNSGTGYFDVAANWASGAPPASGPSDLVFGSINAHPGNQPYLESNYNISSLTFNSSALAYSMGTSQSNTIAFNASGSSAGLFDNASNAESIGVAMVVGTTQTWTETAGSFTAGSTVSLGSNSLTTNITAGAFTFAGAISSSAGTSGGLIKTGAGSLYFNAPSTSSTVGTVNLQQGITNLSGGGIITTTSSGNSYLDASSGNTATLNITGTGSYLNASTSPFFIANGTGHSGTVNITSSGELIAASINVPGAGGAGVLNVLSGGIVQTPLFNLGPTTASGATGNIVISGSGSSITATNFALGAGTGTSGTLTINNSGGLVVSNVTGFGAGAFSINVSGGSYSTGALNSLSPTGGQINLNNGDLNTGLTIQAGAGVAGDYFGGLSGTGIVVKSGGSEQIIDASATVSGLTDSGGIFQISTGTFKVTSSLIDVTVNGSGSLIVNHGATLDASALFTSNYIDGAGAGATMTVDGTGSQYKVGNILDVGFTAGDKGTLIVSNSGQVSCTTLSLPKSGTGIINVSSNGVVNAGTMTIGGSNGGSLLTVASGGSVVVTGTTNFADSFSSTVNISGGSLTTGTLSSTASQNGQIVLTADPTGGTALIINGASGSSNYSGTINQASSSSGGILKSGGSTQTFSGPVDFGGPLTVTGGALAFNSIYAMAVGSATVTGGALNVSGGTLQLLGPKFLNVSGGSLNVTGGASLLANAASNVTIDGTASPTVTVTGTGSVFNASALSVAVGENSGHAGILNVTSGAQFFASTLFVPGVAGNGVLNISSGGIVNCQALYLDFGSGVGSCVATLSGAGSQINTNSLTLSSSNNPGSFTISNSATLTIPTEITFASSAFPINISGGTLTTAGLSSQGTGVGAINLIADPSGGPALTLNGTSTTYGYSGSFSGSGTLLKLGAYTQIDSGTGTLGTLDVNAGTFNLTGGSLTLTSTSALQINGGSLLVNGGATLNAGVNPAFNWVDNATMTVTGSGTTFLGGQRFDVGETGNTGVLIVSSSAQMSVNTLDVPYVGVGTMTVTSSAQVSTGTLNFGKPTFGPSTLTVSAGGALIVTGNSNFGDTSSPLNVNGGTFTTGGLVSTSGNGVISLTDPSSGVALTVNAAAGTNSFSGNFSGTGALAKTGGSTQILAGGTSSIGALTVQAGAFNVTGGSLVLTRTTADPINVTGGTLTINGGATVSTVAGGGSVTNVGGSGTANLTVSGSGSSFADPVGISVAGTSLATLTATQHGTINIGNLYMYGSSALVINSGGMVSSGFDGIGDQSGSITTVTVDGQGSTWSDTVMHVGGYGSTGGTGTVNITNLGAVTSKVTSLESNTATVNINGGTLTTGALASLSTGNGLVQLTDPAFITALTINDTTATDSTTYSGAISGSGSLTKTGASTQILSGNNTFTGSVDVTGGTLTMNNSAASFMQVNNAKLIINSGTVGAAVDVQSGGLLSGQAGYTNVSLFAGAVFLPGAYNGSFAAIGGVNALIQPAASGSTTSAAALTIAANSFANLASSGDKLTLTGPLTSTYLFTKIGPGTLITNSTSNSSLGAISVLAGTMNVSAGSTLLTTTSTNSLSVTGGSFVVSGGASVTGNNAAYLNGPVGTSITVTGSSLTLQPDIIIGDTAAGTLNIQQHGTVTTNGLFIDGPNGIAITTGGTLNSGDVGMAAEGSTDVASATIDGPGSIWNAIDLNVGGYYGPGGTATVTLTNQAAVNSTGTTYLNSNTSTINISGGSYATGLITSFNTGNGTILISDPAGGVALTVNDGSINDSRNFSGTISGTGSVTKTGASTQSLSGNNTFTGKVSVTGGNLNMNNSAAASYQVSTGVLVINTGNVTGPVTVGSGGILSGPASYNQVTLQQGAAFLPGAYNGSFPALTGNSALIQPAAAGTTFLNATISLNAPTTIAVNGSDLLLIGPFLQTNGNAITKAGTGELAIPAFAAGSLNISSGSVYLDYYAFYKTPLQLGTLTVASGAALDLNDASADISGTGLTAINALVKLGFQNGGWYGNGIRSLSASADTTHLTAIGVIQNNQSGTALYTASHQFEGVTPGIADTLLKYTYYGDTNLDGKVDGSDYSRIDAAFLADKTNPTAMTGWFNGDFNYDGVTNGSDYTLMDNAFNTQGALIADQLAAPTAELAPAAGTAAVPEPGSVMIIALGSAGLLGRRFRGRPKVRRMP